MGLTMLTTPRQREFEIPGQFPILVLFQIALNPLSDLDIGPVIPFAFGDQQLRDILKWDTLRGVSLQEGLALVDGLFAFLDLSRQDLINGQVTQDDGFLYGVPSFAQPRPTQFERSAIIFLPETDLGPQGIVEIPIGVLLGKGLDLVQIVGPCQDPKSSPRP